MKQLYDKGLLIGKGIDIATGYGLDIEYLKKLGVDIVGYDKFNSQFSKEELLNSKYDFVTCLYCFNTIPNLEEHYSVLESLKRLSGNIYIAVRADKKSIKSSWQYNEGFKGYLTSSSFQRFYDEELIKELLGECDYIYNGKDFKLIKLHLHIND